MLIFIENTPRSYAWGSREALPHMLGTAQTGEPQAELWLGAHPGSPSTIAKATPERRTLIDLIESDPERYGVNGGMLPFLLKVLAIGAPLSLQVHPTAAQAAEGYAAEELAGVPRDAAERNYGDPHHKPELLVALSDVSALCGFRPLDEVRRDLQLFASLAPEGAPQAALHSVARRLAGADEATVRRDLLRWALMGSGDDAATADVSNAVWAITEIVRAHGEAQATVTAALGADGRSSGFVESAGPQTGMMLTPDAVVALTEEVGSARLWTLRSLAAAHPGDPGILVSLLLHLVRLRPGEAVFLGAGQLHAYLSGIAVEVMASSDNVLRAGLTEKHIDAAELCRIVDTTTLEKPHFTASVKAPGLIAWQPRVPEFQLMRARLHDSDHEGFAPAMSAEAVTVEAPAPLVLIVTEGRVRVERPDALVEEVAIVRRGQSLYVSAGEPIVLSGQGEVFLATVGECRERAQQPRK